MKGHLPLLVETTRGHVGVDELKIDLGTAVLHTETLGVHGLTVLVEAGLPQGMVDSPGALGEAVVETIHRALIDDGHTNV